MALSTPVVFRHSQRRSFGLADPRQQIRLVITVLGITCLFLVLAAGNSYAAYSSMLNSVLAMTPSDWADDLVAQTHSYVVVTLALAVGYFFAMVGASIAFVHRVVGPLVALRRHVDELRRGRYASRVKLRRAGGLHADLAEQLNELAAALESEERAGRAA